MPGVSPQLGASEMKSRFFLLTATLITALVPSAQSAAELNSSPRLLRSAYYDTAARAIGLGSSLKDVHDVFGNPPDESDGTFFSIDGDGVEANGDVKQ